MTNLVLFGAPGAGKGTLAGRIKEFSPIVHISTGDLFRANIKNKTPIGKEAKSYIDAGKLVPDEVVIGMVKARLAESDVKAHGFMLDGFPRTLAQAKALDEITAVDRVVILDIDKQSLKERILGRRSCPKCGRIYNIYNPKLTPKKEGSCDSCGFELSHRSDDNEETFEKRWNTYKEQSDDVIDYYKSKEGLVVHVDSNKILGYSRQKLESIIEG
jgi:adenylate kinase